MAERVQDAAWRPATLADVEAIDAIGGQIHTLLPERPEVVAEKIRLFGEGCLVLMAGEEPVGYGIAHPWRLDAVPALDTLICTLPAEAECIFIHDVAILPGARARGAGAAFVRHAGRLATDRGLDRLALVSVYDTHPVWARCGFEIKALSPGDKLKAYGPTAKYMVAALGSARTSVS